MGEDKNASSEMCCRLFGGDSFYAKKGVSLNPLESLVDWWRSNQYMIYDYLRYDLVPSKSVLDFTEMLCSQV